MALRLSTKARYGLRAMIDLALSNGSGPVLVRSIAARQAVSTKYLHALLATLKAAGLVRAVRGSGGGFMLARPAEEIHLGEILAALEGPLSLVDCVRDGRSCDRSAGCAARDTWASLSRVIEDALASVSLESLAADQRSKVEAGSGARPGRRRSTRRGS
jgi:Rrf2 family protein